MSQLIDVEVATCYHCGDPCKEDVIVIEGKPFCCNGCKTVYEILQEHNLCTYYDFERNPGISLKGKKFGDKYAFLANEEIVKPILDFHSDELCKIRLHIPSIHCSSCIWLLENLYNLKEGMITSRVDFIKKEIALSYHPGKVSLQQIVELLATLGYEPDISLENFEKKAAKKNNRSIFLKLGITGFCTGNIMALSFPEYFGLEHAWDMEFKYFVSWLNLILAQAVLFYGASGYFISAYNSLKEKVINLDVPISIGIFAIYARSMFELLAGTGPGYFDSFTGLVFLLLIGKWLQHRTYESLSFDRNFKSYFPLATTRVKGNKQEAVPVTQLVVGDKIQIRNQELIPADSVLLSPSASIDYSFVTGESDPVEKVAGDYIYAGGRQIGANIELEVKKPVSQSYLTQLWNNEAFSKKKALPMTRLSADFSRYFTIFTLALAFIAAAYWYFANPSVMWNAFTAVLIVACPCALSLAMPFTMENTMRIFGRNGFYVKSPEVIQHMATISKIVFDKTGTLTQNRASEVGYEGIPLADNEKELVKSMAVNSTHPLSRKIAHSFAGAKALQVKGFQEIPGRGISGVIEEQEIKLGSRAFVDNTQGDKENAKVYVAINGINKGYFAFKSSYRQGIQDVIERLKPFYKLSLLSGDKPGDLPVLKVLFGDGKKLNFGQKPNEKLNFIKEQQENNEKVMMIGDGLNDAGALKQSDVGMVITDDVHAFFPACDVLADAKSFMKLPNIVRFSKTSVNLVKVSFLLSMVYNTIALSMAVSGLLTPVFAAVFMPLSSISVVGLAVGLSNIYGKIRGL